MNATTREVSRLKVSLSESELALVAEISEGVGCSRAAVVGYLLSEVLAGISAVPKRSRVANVRSTRLMLKGHDDFVQGVIRNATAPSAAYISTALEGLLTLAGARHGSGV